MHILICTIGSSGDVHPFIAEGLELKRRGHHVTLITGEHFGDEIRKAGLDFVSLFSAKDYAHIMDHPDLWHPTRGFKLLYQTVFVPMTPVLYNLIKERYHPGETGVVASTLGFGARVAQEKLGVPVVTVHLQPACIRSAYDTPALPGLKMGPRWPRWLKQMMFVLMDMFADHYITPNLNPFRKSIGLPPVGRIFKSWIHSPESVIGLFPDWYAPPQPDWPPHTRLSGFPLYDAGTQHPISRDLQRFLDEGEPPVMFTAGSSMKQGRWFFDTAVDVCRELKCRGVMINAFRDQLPETLPPEIFYAGYAPFSAVFPSARAVVHHGGIGTTAQVMAAGVPQLIVPLAFDQHDQAMRVERLEIGRSIPRRNFHTGPVSRILREILNDSEMAERARDIARRFNGPQAVTSTCDLIEQSFRKSVLSS